MNSLRSLKNSSQIFLYLGLAFSLLITLFSAMTEQYFLICIPFVFGTLFVIVFIPRLIPFFFLASNFYGGFLLDKGFIAVTLTDIAFLIVLLGYWGGGVNQDGERVFQNVSAQKIQKFLIIFFLCALFSFLFNVVNFEGVFIYFSLWYLIKLCQLFIIFRIFSIQFFSKEDIERVLSLCIILSLFQLPIILIQTRYSNPSSNYDMGGVSGTFTYHPSMIALCMIIPMAFSMYRFFSSNRLFYKVLYACAGFISLYILFASASRSAIFGIAISVLFAIVISFRFKTKIILNLSIVAIALVFLYNFLPLKDIVNATLHSQDTGTLDLSSYSRFYIWYGAYLHFLKVGILQKLFGIGIGTFSSIPYEFVIWGIAKSATGAHNNFLHVLLEIGIVGFISFILLFFFILKELYKYSTNMLCRMFFFLTIALLASGLTQETFWFQKAFGSFWLYYIFLLAIVLQSNNKVVT